MRLALSTALLLLVSCVAHAAPHTGAGLRHQNRFSAAFGPQLRSDPALTLDIDNARVKDALKQIMEQAGQEYVLDADVPDDPRVTIRARDVKLSTALDLVTQAAGIRWAPELRGDKTILRFGKTVRRQPLVFRDLGGDITVFGPGTNLQNLQDLLRMVPYRLPFSMETHTFTCPHCKGQATVTAPRQQATCPQCDRVFQSNWAFCPFDGSKRPAAQRAWQFCPLCGKQVEVEKPAASNRRGAL